MQLVFRAIADDTKGSWADLFHQLWPAYRRWYLSRGTGVLPTYHECRQALRQHMPELVPLWEQACERAGGGDLEARFLSLYRPPPYVSGCSQAVWPGEEPLLVRNYDYDAQLVDGVILLTRWSERRVIGSTDCLIGLVDGMNDAGLAVSLTFGGRRTVGNGFGVPIVLRYVLEICETAEEAAKVLARVPIHMAYNVTALDRLGHRVTVHLSPDRTPTVTRSPVATNHQEQVEWMQHAQATASVEREHFLLQQLIARRVDQNDFIRAFLKPPLFSLGYERGFGTLFTAAYWPRQGMLTYIWPGANWRFSFDAFEPSQRLVRYAPAA